MASFPPADLEPMLAAHADWSIDPRKRWVSRAWRKNGKWHAAAPLPVGDPAALLAALAADGAALGAPAVLGLDLPLGLPRGFAAGRGERDFPAFLRGLQQDAAFFEVSAGLDTVSPERPFYPTRGLRGMTRAAHAAALGLTGPAALNRWCDLATAERPAGAPLFWTLGANQTGKAAISAWRGWLCSALRSSAPPRLWPFDGSLRDLLAPGRVVLAETYPAEAMRHLGVVLGGSKRSSEARRRAGPFITLAMARLGAVAEPALAAAIESGFGADAAAEDRFDSVLGLLCVIGVLEGARPDFIPADPWVRRWEGWVLGQTALPPAAIQPG
ncbi:hypothetical protein ACFOD4_14695 [Pseudoroseomonas globiformis]|uniref:DUF429 domain-containing protein n=1 Tax=Teichococcus globiformis TaxID=2307229 RepID=A0ABV7G3C1_9PROT